MDISARPYKLRHGSQRISPTIAFPITAEYVQVKERKKINFQITFFFQLSVSHKVVTLSPYYSYIYIYIYIYIYE